MPNPERLTESSLKQPRSQEIVDFVRDEIDKFRSGELDGISRTGGIRSRRRYDLISYVQDEMSRYKTGELGILLSAEELRAKFGYSDKHSVWLNLRKAGLSKERQELKRQIKEPIRQIKDVGLTEGEFIYPSMEWSWMMGILATGGCVAKDGAVSFSKSDETLREAIKSRGERLFGKNSRSQPPSVGGKSPKLVFQSIRFAEALGNFTRDEWVSTMLNRHNWILRDNKYIWSFLEGIFETSGDVVVSKGKKFEVILLRTVYRNSANFLAELLVSVGIGDPKIRASKHAKQGISGIRIDSLADVIYFAKNIHSVRPKREERLSYYRSLDIGQQAIKPYLDEWNKIILVLGHVPSKREIIMLYKLGLTKYGPKVYTRRYGKREGQTNFLIAKEILIRESEGKVFEFDEDKIQQLRTAYEASRPTLNKIAGLNFTPKPKP